MSPSVWTQMSYLSLRSLARALRQPAAVIPALVFPLIFLGLIEGAAGPAGNIPGFPAPSYLDFIIGSTLIQGVLFGGINSGTDLAQDIESGFLNRLALTPVRRAPLLLGGAAAGLLLGMVQTTLMLAAGMIFGVEIITGVGGIAVIYGLVAFISLTFSSVGFMLALRTGSSEAVQSSFPLFFIALTFSSFFLPRELIDVRWFKTIADWNPASYMLEGLRSLITTGWDWRSLVLAAGFAAGIPVLTLAASARMLKGRLAR